MLRPIEVGIYKMCGVDENEEQHWVSYAVAMLAFSFAGFVIMYAIQRLQNVLPLNPQGQDAVSPDLAFNTSVSFMTNTNWQSYVPETTMSYLTQMTALTVHNFVSAATGIALAIALIRGFARRSAQTIGNFWVDLTRCVLYILLPISVVVGLVLIWQGTPENLHAYTDVATLDGGKQLIAQGPVASQEVIKMLGTNGGGFFNANSAHPFENPTALTNLIQMLLIFSIGAAPDQRVRAHGRQPASGLGDLRRHGRAVPGRRCHGLHRGSTGQPGLRRIPRRPGAECTRRPAATWRARRSASASPTPSLFTTVTTDTSCGAVNNMHDSLLPLAGMVPMVNIMLG